MASENAKAVAKEVLETIGRGKRVNKGDIIEKNGYSKTTSLTPTLVTNTKSYQKELKPLITKLKDERDRAIKAMKGKISKAKYRDLTDGIDKLTKNIQLLSGKETEHVKFELDEETKKDIDKLTKRSNREQGQ